MAVLGIGVGLLMQNLVLAAQNDVRAADPASARTLVEQACATATAEIFSGATPFALLALIAVPFLQEKPLKTTTTSTQRLAEEAKEAEAAEGNVIAIGRPARAGVTYCHNDT